MNKWILRLVGVLLLGIVCAFFVNRWLHPVVPDAIKQGLNVTVENQTKPISGGTTDGKQINLTSINQPQDNGAEKNTQPVKDTAQQKSIVPPPKLEITALPKESQSVAVDNSAVKTAPVLINPDSKVVNAWIQAGSFSDQDNANDRLAMIKKKGLGGEVQAVKVSGKLYYRVYVGPMRHQDVDKNLAKLKAVNIEAREVNR